MTPVRVGRKQRPAPITQEYVRDTYRYVSPPMVVHTAWSEQLQWWLWMECRNEGIAEVHEERMTEMLVEWLMGIRERAQDTPVERPKREVKVGMDADQVEEVKVLLGERYPFPDRRRPQAQAREPLHAGMDAQIGA